MCFLVIVVHMFVIMLFLKSCVCYVWIFIFIFRILVFLSTHFSLFFVMFMYFRVYTRLLVFLFVSARAKTVGRCWHMVNVTWHISPKGFQMNGLMYAGQPYSTGCWMYVDSVSACRAPRCPRCQFCNIYIYIYVNTYIHIYIC